MCIATETLKRSKRLAEFRNLKAEFLDEVAELEAQKAEEDEDWDYCEWYPDEYAAKSKEDEAWDEYDKDCRDMYDVDFDLDY